MMRNLGSIKGALMLHKYFQRLQDQISYKGFHILLRAIGWLKPKYPNIQLRIAGHVKGRYTQSGYTKYLESLIRDLDLVENVVFLGSLNQYCVKLIFNRL